MLTSRMNPVYGNKRNEIPGKKKKGHFYESEIQVHYSQSRQGMPQSSSEQELDH